MLQYFKSTKHFINPKRIELTGVLVESKREREKIKLIAECLIDYEKLSDYFPAMQPLMDEKDVNQETA